MNMLLTAAYKGQQPSLEENGCSFDLDTFLPVSSEAHADFYLHKEQFGPPINSRDYSSDLKSFTYEGI